MPLDSPVQRDGDNGFIGFASRLNPLTLPAGMLQDSVNMRLDRGVAQTRKGSRRLTDTVGTAGAPLTLDFTLGTDKSVTSITRSLQVATVTCTAHGFATNDQVNMRGATQTEYNGDFLITVTGTDTFTYTVSGTPATPATGTIVANNGPEVRDNYSGGLYAAGSFASQNYDNASEYIVMVGTDTCYLWKDGASPVQKTYPTSPDERIEATDTVSVVQAFDRLYILREAARTISGTSGQIAAYEAIWGTKLRGTEVTAGTCTITIASPAVITKTAHGLEAGMPVVFSTTGALPTGLTAGTIYYVISTGLATDSFRVSTSAGGSAVNTSGTQSGTHTVTPVSAIVSTTTATIYSKAHGYSQGARVRLEGSAVPAFDGHEYDIQSVATDSFTVTVPNPTGNDLTANLSIRRVKPPIYWGGGSGDFVRAAAGVPAEGPSYTKMPSTGWATYFNNRLWLARNRDTVGISDFLDADLYDPAWNTFRAGAGGDDRIVAVHPWVEGQALVFCRKSIWLATLNQFQSSDGSSFEVDLPLTNLQMLTNEIGCSARNTICTAGQYVFFLSDAGIYRLDSRLDLKLRGDTMPLSEPIADLFSTVVQSRVEKSAFAVWHNNRYIVALPTSTDPLDGNQLVIAWNALNNQWEYRDTYPSSASVNQIIVATYSNQRRVFSVARSGNLFLLDDVDSASDDNAFGAGTSPITGRIKTRRFDFKDMHSKRFLRTIADVVLPDGSSVTAKVSTINPDQSEQTVNTLTNSTGGSEDYNMKSPVRFKAHAAEVIYETSNGRPEIRSASIEASPKSLPPTETRNAA